MCASSLSVQEVEKTRKTISIPALFRLPERLNLMRTFCARIGSYYGHDPNLILVNRLTTYEDSVCYSIDRYELVDKGQIVQTEVEVFNVRLYDDPLVLTDMLKEIGFREIKVIKAVDRSIGPDEDDSSIVYECRK